MERQQEGHVGEQGKNKQKVIGNFQRGGRVSERESERENIKGWK